jgi:hypothetical protein
VLRNRNPPRLADITTEIVFAPENGGLRKNRRSISGSDRRDVNG